MSYRRVPRLAREHPAHDRARRHLLQHVKQLVRLLEHPATAVSHGREHAVHARPRDNVTGSPRDDLQMVRHMGDAHDELRH